MFIVLRQDGKEYTFSEADFSILELDDFEFIYHEFRQRTNRPQDAIIVLNAIDRFMRRQVKFSYISDFQIGCESNQNKINLLKPNQSLPEIENSPMFIILEELEFGIVYQNEKQEKCFLRFNEVQKYFDGTLKFN